MGPLHEGSIRRPIAPWANALTTELHLAPEIIEITTTTTTTTTTIINQLTKHASPSVDVKAFVIGPIAGIVQIPGIVRNVNVTSF